MNLEEIKARCEAATEGPWIVHPQMGCAEGDLGIFTKPKIGYGIGVIWASLAQYEDNVENNAAFIVHAREDVPALVAEVEWLQSRLVRAHRMLLDDLGILWPGPGSPVEQLKAKLLHEIQEYVEDANGNRDQ